jgi:soluble lytic murein transglycosylase-like protein
MNLAHMMGWGMLFASSLAVAAGDPSGCPLPGTMAPVPPLARKFSLAFQGCRATAAPSGGESTHEAAQLHLYDQPEAAWRVVPTPVAQPSASASAPETASPAPVPAQKLSAAQRRVLALAPQVQQVARTYDIDPLLLHAIAHVESRHNPQAVSPAGALGLMQVMPETARRFGVDDPRRDLFDPLVSLQVGSAYLKTLQGRFGNNLALVLAAYNAGEGAVEKHRRAVPPFAETQRYVKEVLAEYLQLKAATGTRR